MCCLVVIWTGKLVSVFKDHTIPLSSSLAIVHILSLSVCETILLYMHTITHSLSVVICIHCNF